MRQRLTYLVPDGIEFGPADIKTVDQGIEFAKADQASEEWRLTLEYQELPIELRFTLASFHEGHIRLVSSRNDRVPHPLLSRLPPGLHVLVTPQYGDLDGRLGPLLNSIISGNPLRPSRLIDTCSIVPIFSEHSPGLSAVQFFQLSDFENLRIAETFLGRLCESDSLSSRTAIGCQNLLAQIPYASQIDIDFDAEGNKVTTRVVWNPETPALLDEHGRDVRRQYAKLGPQDRLEVGVLRRETARRAEELSVGGYLTVIGESDRPNPTLFSFASRHRPVADSSAMFLASFQQPTGLHPKLLITVPRQHLSPPKDTCKLHAYMTNPSTLFIDSYQLSDPLFLASQNLVTLESLSGEQDLEAPEWVTQRWGSAALLQLAVPPPSEGSTLNEEDWTVTIPMHLRYIAGESTTTESPSHATIDVPWPVVFWTCDAEGTGNMSTNPFDRTHLGYDALFGPKTIFYHVPPARDVTKTVLEIHVPVLPGNSGGLAQVGTLVSVALGFFWVCWRLFEANKMKSKGENRDRKGK